MDKYSYIQAEEGFRSQIYPDTRGIPTIGYGQRVDELVVTQEQAAAWLIRKTNGHEEFMKCFPWWNKLDEVRQAAVLSMAYQLGEAGLLEFRNFLRLMADQEWGAAADAMLVSEWARQTPSRAHRAALMIRTGQWPVFAK